MLTYYSRPYPGRESAVDRRLDLTTNRSAQFLKNFLEPVPFCYTFLEYQVLVHISVHKFIPIEVGS